MSINDSILSFTLQLLGKMPALSQEPPVDASMSGAGPSAGRPIAAPDGYVDVFTDVSRGQSLSIMSDPDLHHTLYGAQQGREILARVDGNIKRVVMISPSHLKQCGIGEYGRYLSDEMAKQVDTVKVVRTSSAAMDLGADFLDGALVVINHGPGLYDGLNPRLSQGESTIRLLQNLETMRRDMGALPVIIHHSLLDTDHDLLFSRQAQILASNIPSLTFISSAGRHFFMPSLELGVSPVPVPKHTYKGDRDERAEVVGFFGFFQYGGKDFDSLFHLVRELRGRLVGSVATGNTEELKRFNETLEDLSLPHDFGSDWVDDTELLKRLQEADYFYLPQNDYDHWNNSATARFVTNLDRPLFLPPHHPFLDMDDGSIFASKEDLPRIVAHFREPGHYNEAVDRVKSFRERAAMSNTASAIRLSLAKRQGEVGQELLETPSACSAERMLELPESKQAEFAATLGADPEKFDTFPALWRAPDARQYWRKHYEIGDFVHGTLLESICATFVICTKRQITLTELLTLVANLTDEDDGDLPYGETLQSALFLALEHRGGPFYDPEITILENGEVVDWRPAMASARLDAFRKKKASRVQAINTYLAGTEEIGAQPRITNIAQILILPAETLRQRSAPVDLSGVDLDYVHAVRRPAQRLNRLVAQANDAGLRLGDHLVFDHLSPPEVEPAVRSYVMEDFIYYSGDFFVLNAVRCIDKRNPYPIEAIVLQSMLSSLGKAEVLQHLVCRSNGRVEITNFDLTSKPENENFDRFMHVARDPLFGLVEARNAYEIAKRNNTRWWLRNKSESDAIWEESGQRHELLNLLYHRLTMSGKRPKNSRDPIWQMDTEGKFHARTSAISAALVLSPGKAVQFTKVLEEAFKTAAEGFYPLEESGVWTNGKEGSLLLLLDPEAFDATGTKSAALRLDLGFLGTIHFANSRTVTISIYGNSLSEENDTLDDYGPDATPLSQTTFTVTSDMPAIIDLPVDALTKRDVYCLKIDIDGSISPKEIGLSDDNRDLGVRLNSISLMVSNDANVDRS